MFADDIDMTMLPKIYFHFAATTPLRHFRRYFLRLPFAVSLMAIFVLPPRLIGVVVIC